jgi:hypothetical protein
MKMETGGRLISLDMTLADHAPPQEHVGFSALLALGTVSVHYGEHSDG